MLATPMEKDTAGDPRRACQAQARGRTKDKARNAFHGLDASATKENDLDLEIAHDLECPTYASLHCKASWLVHQENTMLTSYVDDVYLDNLARDLFMRYKGTQAKTTWMAYKRGEPPSHHGMTSLSFQAGKRGMPPMPLQVEGWIQHQKPKLWNETCARLIEEHMDSNEATQKRNFATHIRRR